MKKSVNISIYVRDVEFSEIENIIEQIEEILKEYDEKRVDVTLRDESPFRG